MRENKIKVKIDKMQSNFSQLKNVTENLAAE